MLTAPPDLFSKCATSRAAANLLDLKRLDAYPFFPELVGDSDIAPFEVRCDNKLLLNFGSNDYLALAREPKVISAACEATRRYGSACSGSRLLNGTTSLHTELERKLASLLGFQECLLVGTGYQTNLAALCGVTTTRDVIIADEFCHASLVDGMRLSYARKLRFRHNDLESLERSLHNCGEREGRLVVVEGVYSVSGDTAVLPEIVSLCKQFSARILVDDAHGIGILGQNGRGTPEYCCVEPEIDLVTATFSKAFASAGGFIAGKAEVIEYIRHYSSPFVFSASMPPAALAAALASLDIIQHEPNRREVLLQRAQYARTALQQAGFSVHPGFSPAIVVRLVNDGDIRASSIQVGQFCNRLLQRGFYVNAVMGHAVSFPVVRVNITAAHQEQHINNLIDAMLEERRG